MAKSAKPAKKKATSKRATATKKPKVVAKKVDAEIIEPGDAPLQPLKDLTAKKPKRRGRSSKINTAAAQERDNSNWDNDDLSGEDEVWTGPAVVDAEIVDDVFDTDSESAPLVEGVDTSALSEDVELDNDTSAEANDLEQDDEPKAARLPAVVSASSKALSTTDPVAAYLAEIRRYPLLTPEQERELAIRYKETGDPKAAEQLVTSNLRFVVKIAAEYSKFGARLIDLIQEGNIGLMQAVREFNPYKGVRVITYAVWWIRGYIQDYLMRQYSLVRIGTTQTQRKLFYQLQKQREELEAIGAHPDYKLLGSRLGVSAEDVESMQLRLQGRDVSLNAPLDASSESSLMDFQTSHQDQSVEDQLATYELLDWLHKNIENIRPQLKDKELIILDERLLADDPLTLQEIGEKYGITREAVRQIEARLIDKLRKNRP
jgi:RNA polymerase sigma-32 factor